MTSLSLLAGRTVNHAPVANFQRRINVLNAMCKNKILVKKITAKTRESKSYLSTPFHNLQYASNTNTHVPLKKASIYHVY